MCARYPRTEWVLHRKRCKRESRSGKVQSREEGGDAVYLFVFAEINLFCILILLLILNKIRTSSDQQTANLAFKNTILSLIAIMSLDVLWTLVEGRASFGMRTCNAIINVAYLILISVVNCFWLQFTERKLGVQQRKEPFFQLLRYLPVLMLAVLSISSVRTGWIFYLSADNTYHHGPYHFLQFIFAYSYMGLSIVYILRGYSKARTCEQKAQVRTLASFFVLPVTGGMINVFVEGIPLIWPFSTLSLMMVFMSFQDYAISTDGLTGLNNRRQLDSRFQSLMQEGCLPENAFLLLLDIDHFKQINDSYGHYEGDLALRETAGILKKAVGESNLFLARYGGDEFAVLGYTGGENAAQEVAETICRLCCERNAASKTPYDITMSVGYAVCTAEGQTTIPELIAEADRMLYSEKALHRGGSLRIN